VAGLRRQIFNFLECGRELGPWCPGVSYEVLIRGFRARPNSKADFRTPKLAERPWADHGAPAAPDAIRTRVGWQFEIPPWAESDQTPEVRSAYNG